MSIIKDLGQIRSLIPTFKDLARCRNFASVEDEVYREKPLFAFSVNTENSMVIRTYKVKFLFLGLTSVYALVLTGENGIVGRYCDFVGMQRDITKPVRPEDWKWSNDEIGISIKSDNSNHNFVYFGSDEDDIEEIKKGLKNGLRKETEYKELSAELRSMIMESLKRGAPVNSTTQEKRNKAANLKRNENIDKLSELAAEINYKPSKENIITTEIVII